jgi:16S rRNA (guanine527-N7)-methyltransferase
MADVSRETVSTPDPAITTQVVAPGRLDLLEQYAGLLASEGVVRGLIGPREVPRLWDRHLLNCALLGPLIGDEASVVDLGSGAGLPGLVLAIARQDLRVTLVEPMARRVAFLEEVRDELGLEVEVVRGRADDCRRSFDVVTARALAPLPKLLGWGMALVGKGGQLLAMKGSSAAREIEASDAELLRWGARAEVVTSSVPGSSETTVVRVVRDGESGIGLPTSSTHRGRREHA